MARRASISIVRDPKYYFPDGNTVILVKDTLFKVHRFQLVREQSVFENMFSCPTVESSEKLEGECDENPIELQGDSVEEVRALIGYLYSLPHDAQKDLNDVAEFHRCCRLARIAHKYAFGSIEKWALGTIKAFWTSTDFRSESSATQLMGTTRVASLCQEAALIELVTNSWIKVIEDESVSKIAHAINVAEQYGLSRVKGSAYYHMMIQGRNAWKRDGVLTVSQRLRLLSGFHELAHDCSLLEIQEPPKITHITCSSTPTSSFPRLEPSAELCKSGWGKLWRIILTDPEVRNAFRFLTPADYLGRLSIIAANLKKFYDKMSASTKWRMSPACLASALTEVKAMSADCTRRLPGMFVDLK